MAYPTDFPGANRTLIAQQGVENIDRLPVFTNGVCCVSCWQLSPGEVAEVARTGKVFVAVLSGLTQPPIFAGGEESMREVLADYGVWPRG